MAEPSQGTPSFKVWLSIVAILLVGFGLRLYSLNRLPPQANIDEAWFALQGRTIWETGHVPPFYKTWWGGAVPLMPALTALVYGFGIDTIVAGRVVAACAGFLLLPVIYRLTVSLMRGRQPASWHLWTGVCAAWIGSYLFLFLHLSRFGWEPIVVALCGTAMVWQFERGLRGHWSGWLLGGIALGCCQLLTPNARPLCLLAVFQVVDSLLSKRQRWWIRLGGATAAMLTALAVTAPTLRFYIREPYWLAARFEAVSLHTFGGEPAQQLLNVGHNILATLNALVFRGDGALRTNLPYRPLLDPMLALGGLVGGLTLLLKARRARSARLILAWAALTLIPTVLTDLTYDAPDFQRLAGFVPPAIIIVAVGWQRLLDCVSRRWASPAVSWMGLACLGLSMGLNLYDYFGHYLHYPGLDLVFNVQDVAAARFAAGESATSAVIVTYEPDASPLYVYPLADSAARLYDFARCPALADERPTDTYYVLVLKHYAYLESWLKSLYPSGQVARQWLPSAVAFRVPADTPAPAPSHPMNVEFEGAPQLVGYDLDSAILHPGDTLTLTLHWKLDSPNHSAILSSFVHIGSGTAGIPFVAQSDGPPCNNVLPLEQWWLNETLLDERIIAVPADAPPGTYPILLGWYTWPDIQRLPIKRADSMLPDQRAIIGAIEIVAP